MRIQFFFLFAIVLLTSALACNGAATATSRSGSVPDQVSVSGAGHSHSPVFSADGRFVAFLSQANNLVTNDDLGPHLDLFLRDLVASNTVLISVSTTGAGGANDNVFEVALSSNAQFVAFETAASNLAPGDTNRYADIYVRDRISGTTVLVSMNASGNGSGDGPSSNPLISEDGRYVVFESLASNLVTNDFNGTNDIFIRDLAAGTTTLVTVNADGSASPNGPSHSPSISASGLRIAFVSHATNLFTGVTNQLGEVYVRDVGSGSNLWAMASHLAAMYDGNIRTYSASQPTLSTDGRYVAFRTRRRAVRYDLDRPTNFVFLAFTNRSSPTPLTYHQFLDNPRVSHAFADAPLELSRDGRFLVYGTTSQSFWASRGIVREDFETLVLHEDYVPPGVVFTNVIPTPEMILTNLNSMGFAWAQMPWRRTSEEGSRLFFVAEATNSFAPSTNRLQLYGVDRSDGSFQLLSTNLAGKAGPDLGDMVPAMSADGSKVAWDSLDENVVASDLNRASDVFLRDVDTDETQLISRRAAALPATTSPVIARLTRNALSADGSRLAILSYDSTFVPNDTNNRIDLVIRNLATLSNQSITLPDLIQPIPIVFPPTRLHAAVPVFSANGRYLAFAGEGDIISINQATNRTLFWRDTAATNNRVLASGIVAVSGTTISYPTISPDGRLVAFHSRDQLGSTDFNDQTDVYEFQFLLDSDLPAEPHNLLISATPSGYAANDASGNPKYSPDGSWIVFQSLASDLTTDYNTNPPAYQLFARPRLNTATNSLRGAPRYGDARLVSYTTAASPAPSGTSIQQPLGGGTANPLFSGDSHYVVFENGSGNVVYRHDLSGGYVTNITRLPAGSFTLNYTNRARVTNDLVCTGCANPAVDGNGRVIVYETRRGPGTTNDVILKDLVTGSVEIISATQEGAAGNGSSFTPLISHDARYVVFVSQASDLVPNDTNHATDIFVRDRIGAVTHCVSRNFAGTGPGNRVSSDPVISGDGRTIAFQSFASDLAPGDFNATRDIFVLTLAGPDHDGDGLDDDWEMAYFDTLERNGSGDFDGDGQSDGAEFRAGTNPSNNTSVLRVLSIASSSITQLNYRHTTLLWTAVPGKTYRVQFKPHPVIPWTDLPGDVVASGTTGSKAHDSYSPTALTFYRVVLVP